MVRFLLENAALSAYLAAVSSIVGFLALFIFFAGIPIFGPINDGISVFQMLFLIPVFVATAVLLGDRGGTAVYILTAAASAAALAIAGMQLLLVVGQVRFEQTIRPILLIGLALAGWWLVTGLLSLSHPALPAGLGWSGVASGLSFGLIALAYLSAGPYHPATMAGFIVGAAAVPVWAIWLGRWIAANPLAVSVS